MYIRKTFITFIVIFFFCNVSNAQDKGDFIVIKAHPIVGDTVDQVEKVKYNLYPNISNVYFSFAQYLMKGDQIKLRIHLIDKTNYDLEYNFMMLTADVDKIFKNKDRVYEKPKVNYKKIIIKLTDSNSGKSIKYRKRDVIQYKLIGGNGNTEVATIKEIIIDNEPAFKLRQMGKEFILPLSQINYIYTMPLYYSVGMKTVAALAGIATIGGLVEDLDNASLVSPFFVCSVVGFSIKNRKYYINDSEIKVIYK